MSHRYSVILAFLGLGFIIVGAGCAAALPQSQTDNLFVTTTASSGQGETEVVENSQLLDDGGANVSQGVRRDDDEAGETDREDDKFDDDNGVTSQDNSASVVKPVTQPTPTPQTVPNTTITPTYTMAEVAAANMSSKCWTAVGGKVYDLTPEISRHPGGAKAILSLCGKDGTAAFTAQHGGQRRPTTELNGLQIGILK
jgi:cytochrome b involved in lipid metabolism